MWVAPKSGVYAIIPKTGKVYIGSSVDMTKRCKRHIASLYKGNHHNKRLQRIWNKYGEGCLNFIVMEFVSDKSKLPSCEQNWIDTFIGVYKYQGLPHRLLNHKLQVKYENYLDRNPGTYTEERKIKYSERMKGNQYAKGKSHPQSPDTRDRIANTLRGTRHSEESYKRAADKIRGRKASPEAIERQRKSMLEFQAKKREFRKNNPELFPVKTKPGKPKGERSHFSKLTETQVLGIRERYKNGESAIKIANEFKMDKSNIFDIVKRRSWKHI
jgi:group I intron endonuclease